jgi:hypothetical protein
MTIPTAAVSEQEGNSQRAALLVKAKELTRVWDALAAERPASQWSGWRRSTASRGVDS